MTSLNETQPSGPVAGPTDPSAHALAVRWARGRRRLTPFAYPHLRALGAIRLAAGIFLVGLFVTLVSYGQPGWAAIPLAGAAVNLSIGYLDTIAARFATTPRA